MNPQALMLALLTDVPELGDLIAGHLDDYDGDVLPHLLLPDVLRFSVAQFHAKNLEVMSRCLDVVDRALRDGDEAVANAVAVSFVEHVGFGPGETPEFLALWPRGLLEEKARQDSD